jgi:acetyl-CoA carboxylase biotin carboxyl carrier protein
MGQVTIKSEIAAKVWKIEVAVGMQVPEGETVILLESMKMEIPILAPVAGAIVQLLVQEGDTVGEGQVLAVIEAQTRNVARASQTAPPLLDASAQSVSFGPLQATRNVTFALRSGGGSTRAGRFAFNRSRTRAIHSDDLRPHGVHAGRA